MRKKTILRAIAIVTCLAVLSLSVPSVASARDNDSRFSFRTFLLNQIRAIGSLLPFLHIDADNDEPELTQTKVSKTNTDVPGNRKKVTGTLSSVKPPKTGDDGE
jgi:hypothetical protein